MTMAELADKDSELVLRRQHGLIVSSFVNGLMQSWTHKLGWPLQALKWLLWPQSYDWRDLYPNEHLEPPHSQRGTWIIIGPEPRFAIPRWFPDGWLRLRLGVNSEVSGALVVEAQHGADLEDAHRLAVIPVEKGNSEQELLLRLRRPALAVLLRPMEGLDRFRFEDLRLQPRPGPVVRFLAWMRRLAAGGKGHKVNCKLQTEFDNLQSAIVPSLPLEEQEYPALTFHEEPALDWSVIIPTVNEVQLVCQCIRSCRQQLPKDASLEFIVIDDGTRDPALRQALSAAAADLDFHVYFSLQNLGFSAAVNFGINQSKGRYLVLCNNDIRFFQPWLEPLQAAFVENPRVGVVGARLLYPDGRIQHAGMEKVPNQLRWVHRFKDHPADHGPANESREVWSVTGALLALRRETVARLGGLSTAYALAYEDVDYCLHAWSRGVAVRYCPQLAAHHLEGVTRGASLQQQWGKPRLWTERERLGRAYFERKWWMLRNLGELDEFLHLCEAHCQSAVGG
jgi:GT2 family glycosyltransferase